MKSVHLKTERLQVVIEEGTPSPLSRCQARQPNAEWVDVLLPRDRALTTAPGFPQFGNPVLFPVGGRSYHNNRPGLAEWKHETFQMPLHGIAHLGIWKLSPQHTAQQAEVTLAYQPNHVTDWPFPFELIQQFELTQPNKLEHRVVVKNSHPTAVMPVALGFHPFFTIPDHWHAHTLKHGAKELWTIDHRGLAEYPPNTVAGHHEFSSKLLRNCILGDLETSQVDILNQDEESLLRLQWTHQDFSFLTCWALPEQNIWCFEPWQNLPNPWDHPTKPMHLVEPMTTFSASMSMEWNMHPSSKGNVT